MILEQIKEQLQQLNQEKRKAVARKLGYRGYKRFQKTLDKLLKTQTIEAWLENAHYDLVYTGEALIRALVKVLSLSETLCDQAFEAYAFYKQNKALNRQRWIWVNTNFRRKNEPIFMLAFMERTRNFGLNLDPHRSYALEEILQMVSEIVRKHYIEKQGRLGVWGEIQNYVYYHDDGSRYVFDTEGKKIDDLVEVNDNRAMLKPDITKLI
jgi:hypothetical protein